MTEPELGSGALREALCEALDCINDNIDLHGTEWADRPMTQWMSDWRLSLSSPIESPPTITPQMMSGVFAKSVNNTDPEHDHVYDHRIAAAEINKLLGAQASSEIREPQCDLVELRRIISGMMHTTGGTFKHWQIHDRWSYDERCLKCQLERASNVQNVRP